MQRIKDLELEVTQGLEEGAKLKEINKQFKEINKQLLDNNDTYLRENNQLRTEIFSKTEMLNSFHSLFKEEREEKKILYDRIQEFAGLKERTFVTSSGQKETTFNAVEPKRGRRSVIEQLEARSKDLLKKQQEQEAERVKNGTLAPQPLTN